MPGRIALWTDVQRRGSAALQELLARVRRNDTGIVSRTTGFVDGTVPPQRTAEIGNGAPALADMRESRTRQQGGLIARAWLGA